MRSKLEQRKESLEKEIEEIEARLSSAPNGRLLVCKARGRVRYYVALPDDSRRRYLRKDENNLVSQLAQKSYDADVLSLLKEEVEQIDRLIGVEARSKAETVFERLSDERKLLVRSLSCCREERYMQWESADYDRLPFDGFDAFGNQGGYITDKTDRVRSKSEVIIANALYAYGVPYRYECALELQDGRYVYPDFTVINKRTGDIFYWEHFGMTDDPLYANKMTQKISSYSRSGHMIGKDIIITTESSASPLDTYLVKNSIESFLI